MSKLYTITIVLLAVVILELLQSCECRDIEYIKAYEFDKLSNQDYEAFSSKSPDFWKAADQDTTLKQVLLIHRHGDRTPLEFSELDPLGKDLFWGFHGSGQLTNRGKARLHMLGKIMRMRYNKFLSGSVNKNFRKSRASGAQRCIESAQVFLASFLSLDQADSPDAAELRWDHDENELAHLWQPANVPTFTATLDGMLNEGATCKALDQEYKNMDQSEENKKISEKYLAETKVLKEVLKFETDHFYKWFWISSTLEIELSYFGNKVDTKLASAYDRIVEAGNQAFVIYQSTVKSKRLRAGLLINDMITNMENFRDIYEKGADGPSSRYNKKFVHYSAHDMNLILLLGMFESFVKYPKRPDYASNIIIELHHDGDEWFVKLFYMSHVPEKPKELHITSCEQDHPKRYCTLDKFDETMKQYKIASWLAWMDECHNDLSTINPYAENR